MEIPIVHFFQELGSWTSFDIIMRIISLRYFLAWFRVICIGLTLLKNKKERKNPLLAFIISGGLFFLLSEFFFKHILVDFTWVRVRPYVSYPDIITAIGKQYSDSSFPSSHMASTLALLTVMVAFWRKTWIYALIFALAMAVSRMHNGMHYPSDVLAWAFVWVLCGWWGVKLGKRIRKVQK